MAGPDHCERSLRVGFAVHWQHNRPMTWSGTPWALRAELQNAAEVIDIEVGAPELVEKALRVAGVRRHQHRWFSDWRRGRIPHEVARRRLARVDAGSVDAVIELQDLGVTAAPYYVYQDASFALLQEEYGEFGVPAYETMSRGRIDALRERQDAVYESAAGLFPMSEWLARSMVRNGIPRERITVVNPGMNVEVDASEEIVERRQGPTRRLLFVGRDFPRKSGSQVVAAFKILRREYGPGITLTLAGPTEWPLRGAVPDGVDYLGGVPSSEVRRLIRTHDLFVMPSVSEGFGIIFAEALARGLPCIGRDACAMPEIIEPGVTGELVRSSDPGELAELIASALANDELYVNSLLRVDFFQKHFSWQRARIQMLSRIRSSLFGDCNPGVSSGE